MQGMEAQNQIGHAQIHPSLSHEEYLGTLVIPTSAQIQQISEVQVRRENQIDARYHTAEAHQAASRIQRAYRGYRGRRQLSGLVLDPSERWAEIIKEWRWRSAIAPHSKPSRLSHSRSRAVSDLAKANWRRAVHIAEHAGAGESPSQEEPPELPASLSSKQKQNQNVDNSMFLDLRYFLEMVDQKHRYGANLQVYHEEWLRSKVNQNFFHWLDHDHGSRVDLPGCSREKLDRERIRYLSREERMDYLVDIDDSGRLCWAKNGDLITTSAERYQDSMHGIVPRGSPEPSFHDESVQRRISEEMDFANKIASAGAQYLDSLIAQPDNSASPSSSDQDESEALERRIVHQQVSKDETSHRRRHRVSPATILNHLLRATVKPGTWIYVADTVGRLYVGIKSSGAFQHASFLSGARISSAGVISIEDGKLTYLSPLSGHYRPTTKSFKVFVQNLKDAKVDLSELKVSKAYAVLLGMEYYNKTKKGMDKWFHRHDERTYPARIAVSEVNNDNQQAAKEDDGHTWHAPAAASKQLHVV